MFEIFKNVFNVKVFEQHYSPQFLYGRLVEQMEVSAAKSNFEIKTLFDFCWWFMVNFKWHTASFNMFPALQPVLLKYPGRSKLEWDEKIIPFFASESFQLWGYSNRYIISHSKTKDPWPVNYKKAFRDIIFKLDGNYNYYNNKAKGQTFTFKQANRGTVPFIITNDYTIIKAEEIRGHYVLSSNKPIMKEGTND